MRNLLSARAELDLSTPQHLAEVDKHTDKGISDDGLSHARTVVRRGVSNDDLEFVWLHCPDDVRCQGVCDAF